MHAFYTTAYPLALLRWFLEPLSPHTEVIMRQHADGEPLRHQSVADLGRLVFERMPADGMHVAFAEHEQAPLVFDVDSEGPRPVLCSCVADGRRICDQCWLGLAGAMRAYDYVLRRHFGCQHIVAAFSGGRGWHMYVLDADCLSRRAVYQWMRETIPRALDRVGTGITRLCEADGSRMYTLDAFDPRADPSDLTTDLLALCKVDTIVIKLYREILLPYYTGEWAPRIAGADGNPLATVGELLLSKKGVSPAVTNGYRAASQLALQCRTLPPLDMRVDAFLCITSLFWPPVDEAVKSRSHPIRLWWSPHERSGNLSLPLPVERAHELRPEADPPRWADAATPGTTAHSWMQVSQQHVTDLLERHQRRPRLGVRPAQ